MSNETRTLPYRATALVTGGAQRIGRGITLALARACFRVVVHARHESDATHAILQELAAMNAEAYALTADLADANAAISLIARAAMVAGPLSLLVNNASVFESDAIGDLDAARWNEHFAVNLRAPVFLAEAFAAQVDDAHAGLASIVNITDQRAMKPVPRQFSYSLTKLGLHSATTMLAQALAPRVRVNAVAPGPTLPSPRQDRAAFERQAAALPLGRGPAPDDIAAAVLYLAAARSVTGVTIAVDGGQHIAWLTPDVDGIAE
ncbi:MAG: SDR family oxidoreductase [Rhizobiales bacterium]|nr:SDR family oxidoreductase [Hyphomicrobiales bacterium]